MMKNWIQKKKELLVFLLFCLCTIVIRLFYISRVNGPFIYADEFGYWAHASHMIGHTWAGVMDGMGWYNFGYSFLLAPVFFLSNYMPVIYKIAVLFNAILCACIYGIAHLSTRRLFPTLDAGQRGMIAFAATSFSTYIFYSYVTLCETLLTFLIWLGFYMITSIEEKATWQKCFLLGVVMGAAYMTHNRMLSVIIAAAFCMLLFAVQGKVNCRDIMVWGITLISMIVLNGFFKEHFVRLIEDNDAINALGIAVKLGSENTMEGQTQKIMGLLSLDGFIRLIFNVVGQLWECLSATYLLFGYGVVYAVCSIWRCTKNKKNIGVYLFPLLAMLLSVAISAVFCYEYSVEEGVGKIRMDPLFYGRYNACFLGLFVLLGICFLIEEQKKRWKVYLALALVYIGMAAIMYVRLGNTDNKYLNVVSAIGIHIFHWLGEFAVWKCALVALIGAAVVIGLYHFKLPHNLQYYMACLILVYLFATTALHCMRLSIRGENDNTARYTELFDYLRENTRKDEIVYICDENKMAYDVQTRLVDRIVVCTLPETLGQAEKGAYVIVKEGDADRISMEKYDVCLKWEGYWIIMD